MKMKPMLPALSIVILITSVGYAQENRFFMPSEIAKAYDKGTRSYDGKPGPNYWQNTVDYHIDVTIAPDEKVISGKVKAIYHNESPDEINSITIRLYSDAFKKGNSRILSVNDKDVHDGVELENVTINGEMPRSRRRGTNIFFTLKKPLKPGANLTFEAGWKQKIPQFTSNLRQGAYDSTTFFIAYWYPQISVYDDLFGWDNLNFTFLSEFYNNLANFDVTINAPKEFIVWATGTLENAKDIFPKALYKKYRKATTSGEIVSIVNDGDLSEGLELANGSWHFTASEVTDFAIAMSDQHRWDAVMQRVDDRDVLINSVYPNDTSRDYSGHIAMQQKSMQYLSNNIPGIPYPYEAFTTFINSKGGGGGMEFPMMANNGGPDKGVTIHEMFHTYFPMYVRTNERKWSWMDEGWADFNTAIVVNRYFDSNDEVADLFAKINPGNSGKMGTTQDLPLIVSTEFLTWANYGYASYPLPALIYGILHQELGDELFLSCYREYISRWAKKSPTPYDFFYTFENVSGRDLSWLWKPWFFEFGDPDVAIKSVEGDKLNVDRLGNKPVPLIAEFTYEDGGSKTVAKSAGIWENGENTHQLVIPEADKVKSITLNLSVADVNMVDNMYPSIKSMYENVDFSADLLGEYRHLRYGFNFHLILEDEVMCLKTNWGMSRILYPADELNFVSLDKSIKLTFSLDDSGAFEALEISWFDNKSKARKL